MQYFYILLAIFTTFPILTNAQYEHAQNASWCGTDISDEGMQAFYQRDKSHLNLKTGNYPTVYIPIVYHLVGEDNGTGYYELSELFRAHCELQDLFNNADIVFYIKDIQYVDNSNYYSGGSTYPLFTNYNDRDACNVFLVSQMSGVCGYSFVPSTSGPGPNRGGIMLAMNCMEPGNTTYRHEMGHYLNLPHTFYGWEGENPPGPGSNAPNSIGGRLVERADQSNCLSSGDGFCDTPPDYLSDRWTCNFARTYQDPNGISFTIDEKNFMSYSNDGCSSYLKDDQLAEVNAAPASYRSYLLNDPIPSIDTIASMGGLLPQQNTLNLNSNEVVISWDRTINADYYHLQATRFSFNNPSINIVTQDTFYVISNPANGDTYEWRVKPVNFTYVCAPFTPIRTFSISTLSAEVNVNNSSCIQNTDGSIEIIMSQPGSYDYYWSCNDPFVNSGIQNVNSNVISNLGPETYSVIVVSNSGDTLFSQVNVDAPDELIVNINQVGNQLVASVSGGTPPYSYIWDNGSESLTLANIESGDYTFIVIDQLGCQKSSMGSFNNQATGIIDQNLIGNIILAPNPSQSGLVKLLVPMKTAENLEISIMDVSGKVMNIQNLETKQGLNTFQMDLSMLSKGVYIVHARSFVAVQSAKLVIQ